MKIRIAKRCLSIILVISLCFSLLYGCGSVSNQEISDVSTSENIEIDTESISESINENIDNYIDTVEEVSNDWEQYLGNIDALVYGLLISEYELVYTVFNAYIELSDGTIVYGIGYTNYADYYETDDKGYFPAGFISLIGEPEITETEIETGLEIYDLDCEMDDYGFVYAYSTDSYMEHCVVWGQYLQYGVDKNGSITYQVQNYERGYCNEELGSLYSYDEGKYVYDTDVGTYTYISGTTLTDEIDYDALEAQVNEIIANQDYNFSEEDIETSVYKAQEAVVSYLLSTQEETFMGYKVDELVEMSQDLDPMECITITPSGTVVINVSKDIPDNPEALTKWLVGISCGIMIASSIALDTFVPAARPLSGAISGAASEAFMEVVIQNHDVDNINWEKVAVAALSGAILAWACPLAASKSVELLGKSVANEVALKLVGYGVQTVSNAVVTGATSAAFTVIDGGNKDDAMDSFLMGAAIGAACTVVASLIGEGVSAGMKALEKSNPNNWLVTNANKFNTFINEHQVHLKNQNIEDILAPKSVYEATRQAMTEVKIYGKTINQITADDNKNFVKFDGSGNVLTKNEIEGNGGNFILKLSDECDPQIRTFFDQNNITEISFTKGNPDFSSISEYTFSPAESISPNRSKNLNSYYKQLANDWVENPELIPTTVKNVLTQDEMDNLTSTIVEKALSNANLTPHETTNNEVQLVNSYVHSKISHLGGVSAAKSLAELETSVKYISNMIYGTPVAITGTLIAEGASN